MGRASLKLDQPFADRILVHQISRPYGPGLIEALPTGLRVFLRSRISRPYGPGLIEAERKILKVVDERIDFPALWAGPH